MRRSPCDSANKPASKMMPASINPDCTSASITEVARMNMGRESIVADMLFSFTVAPDEKANPANGYGAAQRGVECNWRSARQA